MGVNVMGFNISLDTMVVTSCFVTNDGQRINEISHQLDDEDDGCSIWQFHCGNGDYSMEKMQLVMLKTVIALDLTILEAADLPQGYVAKRSTCGTEWIYELEKAR
jgi:hypothetical protein